MPLFVVKGQIYPKLSKGGGLLVTGGDLYDTLFRSGPRVVTQPATEITATTAVLHGSLVSMGGASELACRFLVECYGLHYPIIIEAGTLTEPGPFSAQVTGLWPNSLCGFAAVVGESWGNPMYFNTLLPFAGSGTELDPYQIRTLQDLVYMRVDNAAHYKLMNDLDAGDTANWNDGKGWIGLFDNDDYDAFSGVFDGDGHKISNLYQYITEEDAGQGIPPSLLGAVQGSGSNAIIKNLLLENVNISCQCACGIALVATDTELHNVGVTGNFTVLDAPALTTERCFGSLYYYGDGVISNCFARVSVTVADSVNNPAHVFGLCYSDTLSIQNSYAVCDLTVLDDALGMKYGLCPSSGGGCTATSSYWDSDLFGSEDAGGVGAPKTTAELQNQQTYIDWDFVNTWTMIDYPWLLIFPSGIETVRADLLRTVHRIEAPVTDTVRNISVPGSLTGDTRRSVSRLDPLPADTFRNTVLAAPVPADLRRRVSIEELLASDTLRMLALPADFTIDTYRAVIRSEAVPADTYRVITLDESVSADLLRLIAQPAAFRLDTYRIVSAAEVIPADTRRSLRMSEAVPADAVRKVSANEAVLADLLRVISRSEGFGPDTYRVTCLAEAVPADTLRLVIVIRRPVIHLQGEYEPELHLGAEYAGSIEIGGGVGMTLRNQNFSLYEGNDKELVFTVPMPKGMTLADAAVELVLARDGAVVLSKTGLVLGDDRFKVILTPADTADLAGVYTYQAQVTFAGGKVATVTEGKAKINGNLVPA